MKTTELCESLCRPAVEALGFTLCEVEFQKEYGDWVLTFFIDKEGGVTIDGLQDPYGIKSSGIFKNTDCYAALRASVSYDLWAKCRTCHKE